MTKQEVKSDQQRENIIHISREMFAKKGYEATTTRMITHAADISEGALYYYFPHGKHEILDAIIYQGVLKRMSRLQVSLDDCPTIVAVENQLMKIFDSIWQIFQDEENYQSFMITIHERMLLSDNQANWLLNVLDEMVDQIAEQLGKAAPFRLMNIAQLQAMARVIISIFQKVIYDELLIKNTRELSVQVKETILPQLRIILGTVSVEDSVS